MRILANENFPLDAVLALRRRGHDVAWVREETPGISDREVLERAQREGRLIVTFDKDFGELAFHAELPAACGIVLFRITARSSTQIARIAVAAIEGRPDLAGHFSVVEDDRIRMTPLPSRS